MVQRGRAALERIQREAVEFADVRLNEVEGKVDMDFLVVDCIDKLDLMTVDEGEDFPITCQFTLRRESTFK